LTSRIAQLDRGFVRVPCGARTQHTTFLLPEEFCHQLMVHIKVFRLFLQIRLPSSSKLPSWQAAGRVLCLRDVSCWVQGLELEIAYNGTRQRGTKVQMSRKCKFCHLFLVNILRLLSFGPRARAISSSVRGPRLVQRVLDEFLNQFFRRDLRKRIFDWDTAMRE
jgi:hypothetical protein